MSGNCVSGFYLFFGPGAAECEVMFWRINRENDAIRLPRFPKSTAWLGRYEVSGVRGGHGEGSHEVLHFVCPLKYALLRITGDGRVKKPGAHVCYLIS